MRLTQLREEIIRGQYAVDPRAVADAVLRRWLERPLSNLADPGFGQVDGSYGECS